MAPKKAQYQSNLDAFLGVKKPKKNDQKRLDSFFGKKKDTAKQDSKPINPKQSNQNSPISSNTITPTNSREETKKKRTQNSQVGETSKKKLKKLSDTTDTLADSIDHLSETSDDDQVFESAKPSQTKSMSSSRTRLVVEDSDSECCMEEAKKDKNDNEIETSTPADTSKKATKSKLKRTKSDEKSKKLSKKKSENTKEAQVENSELVEDGKSLTYANLCETFDKIESITGRLEIQEILTEVLRREISKSTDILLPILYLASNSVAPAYECLELGVGDAILIKAVAEAYGTNTNVVKQKYDELGDLGEAAQTFKGKQRTLGKFFTSKSTANPLGCNEVLTTFRAIAETKGNMSQKWKSEKIKNLLVRATQSAEPKYILRGLQGKLRIGLAQSTVLISLAHALAQTIPPQVQQKIKDSKASDSNEEAQDDDYPEQAKAYLDEDLPPEKHLEAAVAIVKKAYSEVPSYDALLKAALEFPLYELHKACTLTPGIPVAPMLAKPTKSIQEVLKRLNGLRFTCEYKYDGERAQIHVMSDGTTKVFSRNLLDTSEKYPEVSQFVKEACSDVSTCVLDAEVVAYNTKTQQLVPFQVLSTRKKTEQSAETAKVQVIVQAFDLMFLNGKSLLNHTLAERRDLMHSHFNVVPGKFKFAVSLDHQENGDTAIIDEFLDQAVKGKCEGLMIKTLDVNAIYEPSRRSLNWLKLKKDYLEGLGDSVDLVPLGAYFGRGKRTGFYGAYLLACYDPDTEQFQSVCKIGTGFSDEDLKSLAESLNNHKISEKSSQYCVSDQLDCDVWFDAVQVWEVKAADLSKSSAHRGAEGKTGEAGRGIGLRFPRFERLRDDKKPDDATTSDQILEMYFNQDTVIGGSTGAEHDDDGI